MPNLTNFTLNPACRVAASQRCQNLAIFVALLLLALQMLPGVPAFAMEKDAGEAAVPLVMLGKGDEVRFQVFGQSDMDSNLYVADDGTITIPLAGAVTVEGLSPTAAAEKLGQALKAGGFLVNPNVNLTVVQSRSQRVSVLGEVRTPGRYPIDSRTSIFDLLAQAGGVSATGASVVYLIRQNEGGSTERFEINLRGLDETEFKLPVDILRAGDSIYVPRAEQFYVVGEVNRAGAYPLEPDMTVMQAIATAGGVTQRGSASRVDIKRRTEKGDRTISANMSDPVKAGDVIQVKESFF